MTGEASQYQEDVPQVEPIVRHFKIEVGHCSQCRRRVQGRHRLQTSDALGAAGAQLGPNVAALVAELHTGMGLPLAKVSEHLKTKFGLDVTPGGLVHLLHRTARAAAPAYAALCEQVRHSPVVTPDETGWRVNALRHWLWAFATPETTVYAICDGRGFADAAAVLGPDFAGVLVRDGWGWRIAASSTRRTRAVCLTCCADARNCRRIIRTVPGPARCRRSCRDGLALRDRCHAGDISEHGLASARGRLAARLGRLIDAPPPLADAERFAKHLANEFPAVFLFLCDPSIDATNWARRAGHPTRRGHSQGLRRQPHPQGRRHPAGTGQCPAHCPPTPPRPARPDRHDAVRPGAGRPRRTRTAAALLRRITPTDRPWLLPPSGWLTAGTGPCTKRPPAPVPAMSAKPRSRAPSWRTRRPLRSDRYRRTQTPAADLPTCGILEVCYSRRPAPEGTLPPIGGL